MSVYSGFATRNLETQYNSQLYSLIQIMAKRLYGFYSDVKVNEDVFSTNFNKLNQNLFNLEDSKYLPPKFTGALKILSDYMKLQPNYQESDSLALVKLTQQSFHRKIDRQTSGSMRRNVSAFKNQRQSLNNQSVQLNYNITKQLNNLNLSKDEEPRSLKLTKSDQIHQQMMDINRVSSMRTQIQHLPPNKFITNAVYVDKVMVQSSISQHTETIAMEDQVKKQFSEYIINLRRNQVKQPLGKIQRNKH